MLLFSDSPAEALPEEGAFFESTPFAEGGDFAIPKLPVSTMQSFSWIEISEKRIMVNLFDLPSRRTCYSDELICGKVVVVVFKI